MRLEMVIKLLMRELAHTHLILVLMRRNAMLLNRVAMAVFHGLGLVGGVVCFVAVPGAVVVGRS